MTGGVGHEGSRGVELVVGVDTHQDEHVAVAIDRQGVRLEIWPESGGSRASGYTWSQQA